MLISIGSTQRCSIMLFQLKPLFFLSSNASINPTLFFVPFWNTGNALRTLSLVSPLIHFSNSNHSDQNFLDCFVFLSITGLPLSSRIPFSVLKFLCNTIILCNILCQQLYKVCITANNTMFIIGCLCTQRAIISSASAISHLNTNSLFFLLGTL